MNRIINPLDLQANKNSNFNLLPTTKNGNILDSYTQDDL